MVKNLPANTGHMEMQGWPLGREDPLEKEVAIHCSILAWEIPWTEKPGRLQSLGLQRVRHNSVIKLQQHSKGARQQGALVLICISLMISDAFMRTFHVHVGHLYVLFGKISIQFLCLFLNHIGCVGLFFCYSVVWIFYVFWISTPYQCDL